MCLPCTVDNMVHAAQSVSHYGAGGREEQVNKPLNSSKRSTLIGWILGAIGSPSKGI